MQILSSELQAVALKAWLAALPAFAFVGRNLDRLSLLRATCDELEVLAVISILAEGDLEGRWLLRMVSRYSLSPPGVAFCDLDSLYC